MSLQASKVTKRFGGVIALSEASLDLRPGEIHGLIGPNGSGKTTMLNVLMGYYPLDGGAIALGQEDLSQASVQDRAQRGVARTFQKPRLMPSLSVVENVMLGGWRDTRSGMVSAMFRLARARAEERQLRERAEQMIVGVGLGHAMHQRAEVLDHGEQRFMEIARALAGRPDYLLLDEPAGGLTGREIDSLGQVLQTVRGCGVGVLLVEHHTDFVFGICERVTAIDFGKVIARGTANEVRNNEEVVRVYLGN